MTGLIRSLGRAIPARLDDTVIRDTLAPLIAAGSPCCAHDRLCLRIPDARSVAHPDNLEWHQDGGGPFGTIRHMLVWASETPTQLKLPDGLVFTPHPFELIWFDNDRVFHRQPTGTNEGTRWFAKVTCSGVLP